LLVKKCHLKGGKMFILVNLFIFAAYDRILVVDISGSMRRNNLYKEVKTAFKDYIKNCEIGDRIILMTFGTNVNPGVEDKIIQNTQDIIEIQKKIDNFQFNDKWTWMSKAFDIIFKRIYDLQRAYPERPKYILIFTDGNNDPPPAYKDKYSFNEIIRKYANSIKKERTFLYVIMYGVKPKAELKNFVEHFGGQIITTKSVPHRIPELQLIPDNFKYSLALKDTIKLKFNLVVKKFPKGRAVPVYFNYKNNKQYKVFLHPQNFQVIKRKQRQTFDLTIIGINKPGKYNLEIYPKTDLHGIILTPQKLLFSIYVKQPLRIPAWIWILFGLIIATCFSFMIYCKFIVPNFPAGYYVVKKSLVGEKMVETLKLEIKDYQKRCSNVINSTDLEIYDADFKLKIDKSGSIKKIIYIEGQHIEEDIHIGEEIVNGYYLEGEDTYV